VPCWLRAEDDIGRHIRETWELVSGQLNVSGVTALVGTDQVIPGWGVGGRALNPTTIEIGVDPTLDSASLTAKLPSIVAHELHHVARMRGPGYGGTLLEAVVSEGLADHYAEELLGEPLPPWVTALSDAEYVVWLERARQEFDSTTCNHARWFFGAGSIPNWTGYTLGFRLVSDYMDDNPGSTAASLINQPANSFRPD
jgi:hypothetical protein